MWNNKKIVSILSNLETHYHFKSRFQKSEVEQHTGVCLISVIVITNACSTFDDGLYAAM